MTDLDPHAVHVLVGELHRDSAEAILDALYEQGNSVPMVLAYLAAGEHLDGYGPAHDLLDQVASGALHGRGGVLIGDAPADITATAFTGFTTGDPCGYLAAAADRVVEQATAERRRAALAAQAAGAQIERSTTVAVREG